MRMVGVAILCLSGCQRVLAYETVTPIRVFAPLRQPWAIDPRGTTAAALCTAPFGFDLDMGQRIADAVYIGDVLAGKV